MDRRNRTGSWRARTSALGLAVVGGFALLPSATGTALARGTTWTAVPLHASVAGAQGRSVIVQAEENATGAVRAAIAAAGGTVDADLPVVNGFAAHLSARGVAALKARADVRAVTPNGSVRFATGGYDSSTVASSYVKSSGATQAWSQGYLGDGVGVAVIDTGISPMNDFNGRLVHGPDLSGEGTTIDSYGHGTVMAGIVGGSGADSAGNAGGMYAGAAPHATLVGVKVAGRNGAADVSTMLQALHWVSAYKSQFNIRVLNISWGTASTQDPAVDPLNYAVERLWRQGIVVVAAAGNAGSSNGTIMKPGDDPVVLTVGAYNDRGTTDASDDGTVSWTSRGPTATGLVKPDVVAPGRTLVATRSYGSSVEQDNPRALISPSYIKGSGTSEATAVTSGLAALLIQAHPTWTPDQVKAAFKGTASPMSGVGQYAQGAGRVRLANAIASSPSSTQQTFTSSGLGSLEASRGGSNVMADCDQNGTPETIQGEIDVWCQPWDGASWTGASWTGASWTGASWTGASWTGASWTGASWTGASWTGASWTGGTWTGASWTGASWTGASWTGASWTGASWTGASWTGASWTSGSYDPDLVISGDMYLTAFFGLRPRFDKVLPGEISEPRQVVTSTLDSLL